MEDSTNGLFGLGAGDVNGDGLADLIVGAQIGNGGGGSTGEAYILYGKAGTDGTQFGTAVEVNFVTRRRNDDYVGTPGSGYDGLGTDRRLHYPG